MLSSLVLAVALGAQLQGEFEGWFRNPDGTATVLVGYSNNGAEEIAIPIGAGNRVRPGTPDRGQPARFLPGRHWAVFTIQLPKDANDTLTWTLNGRDVPLKLDPLWTVSPYRDRSGNTPPYVSFEPGSIGVQGPPIGVTKSYTTLAGRPLELAVWLADDAKAGMNTTPTATPPVTLRWLTLRGPAVAVFSPERPPIETTAPPEGLKFAGTAKAMVSFSKPGEYLLALVANDSSGEGGGGSACCWTTVHVRVNVR